mmetsp:Transcript_64595/g.185806  ORF Transcript_64595/g.185806 Transcript_64595/m.185806 type:complete len:245 (-) Transcript_64595:395-1129(-)
MLPECRSQMSAQISLYDDGHLVSISSDVAAIAPVQIGTTCLTTTSATPVSFARKHLAARNPRRSLVRNVRPWLDPTAVTKELARHVPPVALRAEPVPGPRDLCIALGEEELEHLLGRGAVPVNTTTGFPATQAQHLRTCRHGRAGGRRVVCSVDRPLQHSPNGVLDDGKEDAGPVQQPREGLPGQQGVHRHLHAAQGQRQGMQEMLIRCAVHVDGGTSRGRVPYRRLHRVGDGLQGCSVCRRGP